MIYLHCIIIKSYFQVTRGREVWICAILVLNMLTSMRIEQAEKIPRWITAMTYACSEYLGNRNFGMPEANSVYQKTSGDVDVGYKIYINIIDICKKICIDMSKNMLKHIIYVYIRYGKLSIYMYRYKKIFFYYPKNGYK